jgi:release factor glutamine methyltransferase
MKEKFSWENSKSKYENNNKKSLPIFYDFYDLSNDFKNVYEPAEDTFLLIDSITNDLINEKEKNKLLNPIKSIEIGCGNGLVSCCYLDILKQENFQLEKHFCIDINKDALNLTEKLIKNYNLNDKVYFIESDLFSNFKNNEKFDIIIFNPPYVTTDDDEYKRALEKKDIYASWAGGKKGSETIFKFISQLKDFIKDDSIIYLLLSKENEFFKIIDDINNCINFQFEIVMKIKATNEKLAVFKFFK